MYLNNFTWHTMRPLAVFLHSNCWVLVSHGFVQNSLHVVIYKAAHSALRDESRYVGSCLSLKLHACVITNSCAWLWSWTTSSFCSRTTLFDNSASNWMPLYTAHCRYVNKQPPVNCEQKANTRQRCVSYRTDSRIWHIVMRLERLTECIVLYWQPTGGRMAQADRLDPKVGTRRSAAFIAHRMNRVNSRNALSMMRAVDMSTIKIILVLLF